MPPKLQLRFRKDVQNWWFITKSVRQECTKSSCSALRWKRKQIAENSVFFEKFNKAFRKNASFGFNFHLNDRSRSINEKNISKKKKIFDALYKWKIREEVCTATFWLLDNKITLTRCLSTPNFVSFFSIIKYEETLLLNCYFFWFLKDFV